MRDIIFIGDGKGVRTFAALTYGLDALGTDISEWAINNSYCKDNMLLDDISSTKLVELGEKAKVIVLYDICEHLNDDELDKCLNNIKQLSNHFVFSIPFEGDPNLLNDRTHKQFMTKEEWIQKIESFGIKIKETPSNWLYNQQILIGEKNE